MTVQGAASALPDPGNAPAQKSMGDHFANGPLDRESRLIRLRQLEEKTAACRACAELAGSRNHVVQGGGDVEADVLFVEEAPSMEQDAEGSVAAGDAAELLEKMLKAMGLSRSDVFVVNVVRCLPPAPAGETVRRRPLPSELDACRRHIEELVHIVRPRAIVALGAGAARGLLGTQDPVARLRSRWHAFLGIPVMPTFHPAYLIENPDISNKRKVWEDLLLVMEKLELPISAKQRTFFMR